jgi:hypothetical protein
MHGPLNVKFWFYTCILGKASRGGVHYYYTLVSEWHGFRRGYVTENAAFALTGNVFKSVNHKMCAA